MNEFVDGDAVAGTPLVSLRCSSPASLNVAFVTTRGQYTSAWQIHGGPFYQSSFVASCAAATPRVRRTAGFFFPGQCLHDNLCEMLNFSDAIGHELLPAVGISKDPIERDC